MLEPAFVTAKTNLNVRRLHSYLLLTKLRKTWQRNKQLVASISGWQSHLPCVKLALQCFVVLFLYWTDLFCSTLSPLLFNKRKPFHSRNPTDMKYFSNKFISFLEQLESLGVYFNFDVCTWEFLHFKLFICTREILWNLKYKF